MDLKGGETVQYDLGVLGTGAAGLTVATEAKKTGASVALLSDDRPGGDCSYYGCVPTKTMVQSAKLLHDMRRAEDFGLPRIDLEPDFTAVMACTKSVIDELTNGGSWNPWTDHGFAVFHGRGRFDSPHEVLIDETSVSAEEWVIAVGSEPKIPPVDGLEEAGFITNVEAVSLDHLPNRLAVLGAGPIGMEFAQVFSRLGADVTVLEMDDQILPKEDKEVAGLLRGYVEEEGVTIRTRAEVRKAAADGGHKAIEFVQGDSGHRLLVDEILVATGRKPATKDLGLNRAGVDLNEDGWVAVDDYLRTSASNIWAVGDCVGEFLFTHVAEYQAGVVAENLFASPDGARTVDYRVVPWVTFTDPPLARVGMTAAQAEEQKLEAKSATFDFAESERARMMVSAKGRIKLAADDAGQILGASVLGPNADELIHEFALAMTARLRVGDQASMIHAYPTLSEAVASVASKLAD